MQSYVIALGSNRRHARHGSPAGVLRAACAAMEGEGLRIRASSPVEASTPLGPSRRRFANAAVLVETRLSPPDVLTRLKAIEAHFGRRPRGRRWGERVLDLDIVLWSGGTWCTPHLRIPHPHFRERQFVLGPLAAIVPTWRDPVTGLAVRHLQARLTAPRPDLS